MTCKCGHAANEHGYGYVQHQQKNGAFCNCSKSRTDVIEADYTALVQAAREYVEVVNTSKSIQERTLKFATLASLLLVLDGNGNISAMKKPE